MLKYRIRLFFNELKVLLLMRSGSSRRTGTGTNSDTQTRMRGLAIGGCGWPTLNCSQRDDEEEYYGSDPRPRSLALEEKEGAKPQGEGLDASSLPSLSESGMRSPQCRICFQGPEKVKLDSEDVTVPSIKSFAHERFSKREMLTGSRERATTRGVQMVSLIPSSVGGNTLNQFAARHNI